VQYISLRARTKEQYDHAIVIYIKRIGLANSAKLIPKTQVSSTGLA
jgi:hypothetical protein